VQNLVAAVAADARSIVVIAREHIDTYVETCSRLLRSDVSYSLPLGPVTSHAGAVAKYCGEHICLSVREDISGTARAIFANFSVHVAYGRGSVLLRAGWRALILFKISALYISFTCLLSYLLT